MTLKMAVLNDFPLFPQSHGGKVRIFNIYKELSKQFKVVYLSYSDSESIEKWDISDQFTAIAIPKGKLHKRAAKHAIRIFGCSVDDILAMIVCKYDRRFYKTAKKYIEEADVIVCSHPYMYPLVKKYFRDKPVIYESHNTEYMLKKSLLKRSLLKKPAIDGVRNVEGELVKKARLVFATSDLDIDKLKNTYKINSGKFYLAPNGTDISLYDSLFENGQLHKDKLIEPPLAIFMGSGHPPNVEAARLIVEKIAPKTRDIYYLLFGSACYLVERSSLGKNIGLAYVISDEEKVELFRCADIALNPMLSGSGTNLKMLDYMAAGLPVITTPIGARGLDLENGRHAIICEIEEFPAKIREVLGNRALYDRLSMEGRKLVEKRYDWKKIAKNMGGTIEKELKIGNTS